MYTDNVSLKYFETQMQVSTKHNTLVLMNVDLMHKPSCDNMVLDALSRQEEFHGMNMIQALWLMYKGEGNLQRKIREGYLKDLEA